MIRASLGALPTPRAFDSDDPLVGVDFVVILHAVPDVQFQTDCWRSKRAVCRPRPLDRPSPGGLMAEPSAAVR